MGGDWSRLLRSILFLYVTCRGHCCESSSHSVGVHALLHGSRWSRTSCRVAGVSSERLNVVIEQASVGAQGRGIHATFKRSHSQFSGKFSARCSTYLLDDDCEDG